MSEYQKQIIEQIEKIGDTITLLEKICKEIESLDPILFQEFDDSSYSSKVSLFYDFIITHRKYTIRYNELRDMLFEFLNDGYNIIKLDEWEARKKLLKSGNHK